MKPTPPDMIMHVLGTLYHQGATRRRSPRGFTLTEVLVVMGIIVVLISILVPVLSRAREAARQTACLGNMRQLGAAQLAFMAHNQRAFPPTVFNVPAYTGTVNFATDGVWNGSYPNLLGCLKPYIGNSLAVYTCPEYYITRSAYLQGSPSDGTAITNYQPNGIFSATRYAVGGTASKGIRLGGVHHSATLILDQEWTYFSNYCFPRPCMGGDLTTCIFWHSRTSPFQPSFRDEEYSNIHSQGANVVYADGHGEWRACNSLHASDFGLTGGAGVTGSATDDNSTAAQNTYLRAK